MGSERIPDLEEPEERAGITALYKMMLIIIMALLATSSTVRVKAVSTSEGTWKIQIHLRMPVIISSTSQSQARYQCFTRFAKLINTKE